MPLGIFQSAQERAAVNRAIAKSIGVQLRSLFQADVERPPPDRLMDCLKKIDEQQEKRDDR